METRARTNPVQHGGFERRPILCKVKDFEHGPNPCKMKDFERGQILCHQAVSTLVSQQGSL